ncbi:MAG: ribonuclease P protein component [Alphaproteobacteria bacterium]|nr:ribonuclease P protein component [Alphaproteobacteria bacterium]
MHARKEQSRSLQTLKKRVDFTNAAKEGRKWVAQGLILQMMDNDLGVRRVGYTVSKRTDKSAVVRNRIKRRLRAAAADILPLHGYPSCDYVLIGRPASADRPYEQLCSDLKWCLRKMAPAKEKPEDPKTP